MVAGCAARQRLTVHLRLIAVGRRPPRWAEEAFSGYVRRLPPAFGFRAPLISPARGHGSDVERARAEEGERLLAAVGPRDYLVALDERGTAWSTKILAERLAAWEMDGRDVALMIGGADGLSPACLERADQRWSLSPLTLPHALVRVLVVEQLYRAWSLNTGHPYHRA